MNNYTSIEMLDTHVLYGVPGDNKARRLLIEQYRIQIDKPLASGLSLQSTTGSVNQDIFR